MVNQNLVNWIKSEEARGYTEKALTKELIKKDYSLEEINEVFDSLREKQKTPLSISFALLTGLGFISLIFVTAILLMVSSKIKGYIFVALVGIAISYYIFEIKRKLNATEKLGAILGILSPTLALTVIVVLLTIIETLTKQLAILAEQGGQTGGLGDMLSIFSPLNPIITGILFYLSCNLFMIISIIKSKEYKTLLWYFFAPALFGISWFIAGVFTSQILRGMFN